MPRNLIASLARALSPALVSLGQFLAAGPDDLQDRGGSKGRHIDFG